MAKTAHRAHPTADARMIPARPVVKALDPKTQPDPAIKTQPIKVRAVRIGYYDHIRRREGDVFIIANRQAFSDKWMEKVDGRTRTNVTSAKQALEREHDVILGGRVTGDANVLGD